MDRTPKPYDHKWDVHLTAIGAGLQVTCFTNWTTQADSPANYHTHTPFKCKKRVSEKSRDCHNHKPQPLTDTKRKRKQDKTKQAQIELTYKKH